MIHLFLFDIDGVLVDARAYQKALLDTVSHFSRLMGLGDHPPTDAQVQAFDAHGLNSEWDSGAACVAALLLERLRREPAFPLAPRWPETLAALSAHPCPLPRPDYAALAKKVGARLGGLSPAQAAHAVLWDEAQAIPGLDHSKLAPLLDALLGHVHDFYRAPVTRHFQHLVLGSQAISQTYGVSPDLASPAYLRRYDRPLLSPAVRALLFEKIASGQIRAALYTTRPSLPPADAENEPATGYAPEAEMAQELVGLETWPLVGRGRLRWLARRAGEELGSLLKPFPVQALAAIGAAWSGQEKAALTAALALHRQGQLIPPLSELEPVSVHVFEDSPGGLQAVELGVKALRAAGLTVSWQSYGIARADSPKAATLAAWGARVYPSINEAVLDAVSQQGGIMTIKQSLFSVYDKSGLAELARALAERGSKLVASGGTARALREAGLTVQAVDDLTGSPEILGGRVKTLHPAIHGGLLSRRTPADRSALGGLGWDEIDLLAVNLYPFEATAANPGAPLEAVIEQIDIGGVALLRAGAKNFAHVTVLCNPGDYGRVLAELNARGEVSLQTRRQLAVKAFERTAAYDAAIWRYLSDEQDPLPARWTMSLCKLSELRYGENPHQRAALYALPGVSGPLGGQLLQGKPLSYNNLLDLDAAWRAASDFERPTIVIVKHLSPCGVASASTLVEAFPPALAGDPVSAFGGVIATNRPFDGPTARALGDLFVEAIAAPAFDDEALEVLSSRQGCRLLAMGQTEAQRVEVRSVQGGLLAQERDQGDQAQWQVVTRRAPSEAEMQALRFAWQAVVHVKSNAIVLAQGEALVGIGGGLPSRVDAVQLAASKAGQRAQGAALASDAFFPFPDGVQAAAQAGVRAIVQPGGSMRDQAVIEAADELGLAMCFTGARHFRH